MEEYPNSALRASTTGRAKCLPDHLECMLAFHATQQGPVTPGLRECIRGLQKQKADLAALEVDYFASVSGGIKSPETVPDWYGWCQNVFKLYERSREWGRQMVKSPNWITEVELNEVNLTEGLDIVDTCRSERSFLLDDWYEGDRRFERLFRYAMFHNVPKSNLKMILELHQENISTFERNLRELQAAPQDLPRSRAWINRVYDSRAQIINLIGSSLERINQPSPSLNVIDDLTRLQIFGHFLGQDMSMICIEIEALERTLGEAQELRIAQRRAGHHRELRAGKPRQPYE